MRICSAGCQAGEALLVFANKQLFAASQPLTVCSKPRSARRSHSRVASSPPSCAVQAEGQRNAARQRQRNAAARTELDGSGGGGLGAGRGAAADPHRRRHAHRRFRELLQHCERRMRTTHSIIVSCGGWGAGSLQPVLCPLRPAPPLAAPATLSLPAWHPLPCTPCAQTALPETCSYLRKDFGTRYFD